MYIHFMDDIKWNKVAVKCYKILHFVSKSSWIKINLLLYDFSDYHFLNSVFSRYATHWNNKKKMERDMYLHSNVKVWICCFEYRLNLHRSWKLCGLKLWTRKKFRLQWTLFISWRFIKMHFPKVCWKTFFYRNWCLCHKFHQCWFRRSL